MEHKWRWPDHPAWPPENIRMRHRPGTSSARDDVVAVDQSRGTGLISCLTNCCSRVGNAHPQRVRWTSRSFAQYVIAVENYGASARAATINTYDQLTQRGKPSRQHVNSWL